MRHPLPHTALPVRSAASTPPTPGKEGSDIGKTSTGSEQSDEEAGIQQVRC